MTREFQLRKLIDCFKDDSNRKEVYYRGTETGLKVFNAHIEFHKIVGYEFYSYFDSLPEESKDAVIDVLCRYSDYMKDLCEKNIGKFLLTGLLPYRMPDRKLNMCHLYCGVPRSFIGEKGTPLFLWPLRGILS